MRLGGRAGALRVPLIIGAAVAVLVLAVAVVATGAGLISPAASCAAVVKVGASAGAGLNLDASQLASARVIYAVGAGLGLPARGEIVALSTAMQESGLRNLTYGTGDALGLFQQEPSEGWGTPAQIMDPVLAARSFYLHLAQVAGWESLPVTVAAQAVQHSAFPGAYAQWEPLATRLAASFGGSGGGGQPAVMCTALAANVVPGGGAGGGNATLPASYELPSSTPLAVAQAIRFALGQLGTAYDFGGSCTDAHSPDLALHCDCSSLVQQAYRTAGVGLPRTTFAQVDVGTPVYSVGALRAGDLLFTAGSDGTSQDPGHVGMYIGDGLIVQAPHTGADVQLSTLSSWQSSIVAMRRIA
jgi:cell wall-associated NlpC family hydrolase